MAKRALLIHNPASRKAPRLDRLRAAAHGVAGWKISIESTTAAGHAIELARQAATEGYAAVVACGGDGTVNEVANGLAGSATALAAVRGGTANVWAKEIGVPKQPERALQLLATGETKTVDLGRAGERYFLMMAGAGYDAAIVRDLEQAGRLKQRAGAASYIITGFRHALRYRAVDAELVADGEALSCRLYWLMLGNTRSYGGVLNLAHMAKADDGKLELLVLSRGGILRFAWLMLFVLLKRHHRRRDVLYRSVSTLDVRTAGLPVQIDGEYLGETPVSFSIAPAALRVIVPRGLRSPLFSGG
jgi:diacylglycerol kinase (ATP)